MNFPPLGFCDAAFAAAAFLLSLSKMMKTDLTRRFVVSCHPSDPPQPQCRHHQNLTCSRPLHPDHFGPCHDRWSHLFSNPCLSLPGRHHDPSSVADPDDALIQRRQSHPRHFCNHPTSCYPLHHCHHHCAWNSYINFIFVKLILFW